MSGVQVITVQFILKSTFTCVPNFMAGYPIKPISLKTTNVKKEEERSAHHKTPLLFIHMEPGMSVQSFVPIQMFESGTNCWTYWLADCESGC